MAQIVVAWRFWAITWDDSAITLGFARTFAQTGQITPTPGSEIVEGYSTTLWMLLMAATAKVITSPSGLLIAAKVSTLLLNLGSLLLMRRWFQGWLGEVAATLVAGAMGCSFMFYETINGMESPLLLFLVFAILLARERASTRGRWIYLGLGMALLLARLEAVWLLAPFVLLERTGRDRLISASTWMSAFLLETAARWMYFGALVPNTITAKRRFPYTTGTRHEQIIQHLFQLDTIARACALFTMVVVCYVCICYAVRGKRPVVEGPFPLWRSCRELQFAVVFLCFSLMLTVGIGANWGPPLRSFYVGWPFLLALLFWPLGWKGVWRNGAALTAAALAMCFVCAVKVKHQVSEMGLPAAPLYMPNATVANVRQVSERLRVIQAATGEKNILYAGPDMGGVQLYSEGVRVLDLGMLCDKTLAHEGYGVVESYVFERRRPDVVQVHGMWTELVRPGSYASFLDNYQPVVVGGMEMFLRKELLARVDARRLTTETFRAKSVAERSYGFLSEAAADQALDAQYGKYLVLH